MIITARANEKVKFLRRLYAEKKLRTQEGVYIAEGSTLVRDLPLDTEVVCFYVRESDLERFASFCKKFPNTEVVIFSDAIFQYVTDTVEPSGILAVIKRKNRRETQGDIVLLLDGVSDAGNMGTILRTAAARGLDTVVCLHACADPFSPKAVRASMGGVFYLNVLEETEEDLSSCLDGYSVLTMDMNGKSIYGYQRKGKIAIAIGNEAHGVSDFVRNISTETVSVPMQEGRVESLNAGVASAIAMYLIK